MVMGKDNTGWPGSAESPEWPRGRQEAGGGGSQGGQRLRDTEGGGSWERADGKGAALGPRRAVPEEGLLGGGPQARLGGRAIGEYVHQEVARTRGSWGCRWGRGCPQPQEVGGG